MFGFSVSSVSYINNMSVIGVNFVPVKWREKNKLSIKYHNQRIT